MVFQKKIRFILYLMKFRKLFDKQKGDSLKLSPLNKLVKLKV